MGKWAVFGGIAGISLLGVLGGTALFQTSDLDRIHAGVAAAHGDIEHIAADDFLALGPEEFVLFDVREADEFAVSHLPGAILVNPAISEAEFAMRFGDLLHAKRAIFYCSVGVRSSILADRVAASVKISSGEPPANLIGGLFKWRNEGRDLVTVSGNSTSQVHPYDDYWGRLIEDREALSYVVKD